MPRLDWISVKGEDAGLAVGLAVGLAGLADHAADHDAGLAGRAGNLLSLKKFPALVSAWSLAQT